MLNNYEMLVVLIPCFIVPSLIGLVLIIHHQAIYKRAMVLKLWKEPWYYYLFWIQYIVVPLGAIIYRIMIIPMENILYIVIFTGIYWGILLIVLLLLVYLVGAEALHVKKHANKKVWKEGYTDL